MKRWRAAREVIDWQDAGRSLLDDPKYKARPLSIKTRARIARGLARYGGPLAPLYIELLGLDPYELQVPPGRGHKPEPFVFANRNNAAPKWSESEPVPTITSATGGGCYLVNTSAEPFVLAQGGGGEARPVDQPMPTILTDWYLTLSTPFLIGQHSNNVPKGVDQEPVPTITTIARIRLIEPLLAPYYGRGSGETCRSVEQPVPTIPTKARFALVDPLAVPYGPKAEARSVEEPLPMVMTRDRLAVATPTAEPFILNRHSNASQARPGVRSADDPLYTITARGHFNAVEPLLRAVEDGEVDPRRVVLIDGKPYLLDIRFRMLKNRELARAMGFDDEESEYEFSGTATEVTKQIGNAVCVHLAAALVTAMLENARSVDGVAA